MINPPLPLRFSISHADDVIIGAVTVNDDIGCDVEMIHRSCVFFPLLKIIFLQRNFQSCSKRLKMSSAVVSLIIGH